MCIIIIPYKFNMKRQVDYKWIQKLHVLEYWKITELSRIQVNARLHPPTYFANGTLV